MSVALDASAVLALLYDEPGKEIVARYAQGAKLVSGNFCEILTRANDKGGDAEAVAALLDRLQLEIVNFDRTLAAVAANLREATRPIGASLGDRACLAFAMRSGLPVLTANRAWAGLELDIDIRLIR